MQRFIVRMNPRSTIAQLTKQLHSAGASFLAHCRKTLYVELQRRIYARYEVLHYIRLILNKSAVHTRQCIVSPSLGEDTT